MFEEHDHEHLICTSDVEQHFHASDAEDCSFLHYQFEIFSIDIPSRFDVIPLHFYTNTYNQQPQITSVVHISKKTSRGPPVL